MKRLAKGESAHVDSSTMSSSADPEASESVTTATVVAGLIW